MPFRLDVVTLTLSIVPRLTFKRRGYDIGLLAGRSFRSPLKTRHRIKLTHNSGRTNHDRYPFADRRVRKYSVSVLIFRCCINQHLGICLKNDHS
jgi:hypothetical protein